MNIIRERRKLVREMLRYTLPILIFAVGMAAYMGLTQLKEEPEQVAGSVGSGSDTPIVSLADVAAHTSGIDIEVSGIVVPYREIDVPTEVAGRVESKAPDCRAGKYVEKGTELFRIDSRDYDLAREEAASVLDELQSEIGNTESLLEIARQQLELEQRDYARDMQLGGAISESELDQAKRELLTAENSLLNLQNQLSLLKSRTQRLNATLRRSELEVARTIVRAPASGMIVSEMVEQDDYVERGATLVTMEDTSKVEVKCNLRKEDMQWLWLSQEHGSTPPESADPTIAESKNANSKNLNSKRAGEHSDPSFEFEIPRAEARILYDVAGNFFQWVGHLERYDGIGVDPVTRTIPCRVMVDNPRSGRLLRGGDLAVNTRAPVLVRGMYVTVQIRAEVQLVQLWRVPKIAIRPGPRGSRIWLARSGQSMAITPTATRERDSAQKPQMVLAEQDIRVVQTLDDDVIIQVRKGKLSPGESVVVSPLAYPVDGQKVSAGGIE